MHFARVAVLGWVGGDSRSVNNLGMREEVVVFGSGGDCELGLAEAHSQNAPGIRGSAASFPGYPWVSQ